MKYMMRAVAVVLMLLGMWSMVAQASDKATAYITVKATATVSVEVYNGVGESGYPAVTGYNFGNVSAAQVYVSTNPIGVRNMSQGAICRWNIQIFNVQNLGTHSAWDVANEAGINKFMLCAKFSTATLTTSDFNVATDTIAYQVDKQYNEGSNFYAYCSAYMIPTSDWVNGGDASKVLPRSYTTIKAAGKNERQMWLRLDTPLAIGNEDEEGITLQITAALAS